MNNYGQLGLGDRPLDLKGVVASNSGGFNLHIPTQVTVSEGSVIISHIDCGGAHTLIVDSLGYLYSSGSNSCGQLSHGGHAR
mmetsp:Transcript_18006/g.24717  ORF Transcript_18006/g.24717 Transcript_18006/m.24717 type:complete len:82 (-) Transcript_18006:1297-1542(-)